MNNTINDPYGLKTEKPSFLQTYGKDLTCRFAEKKLCYLAVAHFRCRARYSKMRSVCLDLGWSLLFRVTSGSGTCEARVHF